MIDESAMVERFQNAFGSPPKVVTHAPGRVNLIGEHTDYNNGFVLPAAINLGTSAAVASRDDQRIRVVAYDYSSVPLEFCLDDIAFDTRHSWSNYLRGVLRVLAEEYRFSGLDILISGDIPQGAGLSSSASLEIAVLKAVASLYDLPLSGLQAARLGQRAENEFVGCACGIMDQTISALGKQGCALLLDCHSLNYTFSAIDSSYKLVIVSSNVTRGLVGSEYNTRRHQCEQAANLLDVASLREADVSRLAQYRAAMPPVIYRRARHVISENQRALELADALEQADYYRVSELMAESHRSMREDFEITVEPVDILVSIIDQVLGEHGGVRMTGGGFGGCVIAVAPADAVSEIEHAVKNNYQRRTGIKEDCYICTAEDGAFRSSDQDITAV